MKYTELDDCEEFYHKVEYYNKTKTEQLSYHYKEILKLLGEDPDREGLVKTPYRVAKAMQFMTRGYHEIYSMCEHHMLPFIGQAHVAYIPNGYITGLSKIARVVEAFSRRLQVQERLTNDIKNCIQNTLNPLGVAVVIEAQHMCMMMRGVQKQNSVTTTSDFSGAFEKLATREEFIRLISNKFH